MIRAGATKRGGSPKNRPESGRSTTSTGTGESTEGNTKRDFAWAGFKSPGSPSSPANSRRESTRQMHTAKRGLRRMGGEEQLAARAVSDADMSVFETEYVAQTKEEIDREFTALSKEITARRVKRNDLEMRNRSKIVKAVHRLQVRLPLVSLDSTLTPPPPVDHTASKQTRCGRCTGWLRRKLPRWLGGKPLQVGGDFVEDLSDDPDEDPKYKDPIYTGRARKHLTRWEMIFGQHRPINATRLKVLQMKAKENLKVAIEPDDVEPMRIKMARQFRILNFLIRKEVKKIRVEEEPPSFPGVSNLVKSLKFEVVIGAILILSCVSVGMNTYYTDANRPLYLVLVEHFFVCVFLTELAFRVMTYQWPWIFEFYNFCDLCIVLFTGVLTMWILDPFGIPSGPLKRFAALRVLRLVRLCRAIRIIPTFSDLWTLVQGIVGSAPLLFWAFVLAFVIHFMFAVALVDIVARSDRFRNDEEVQKYFGDLGKAMFTLFQTMTVDSWAGKVRPIILQMPSSAIIFLLFIGIAGILLFNLMTAIIVKQSIDAKNNDIEALMIQKHLVYMRNSNELKMIFKEMDEDNSGTLTKEEFLDVLDDVSFVRKMKMLDIDLAELPEIFEILDDGDGLVTQDEFTSGLMKMQGPPQNKEMLKANKAIGIRERATEAIRNKFLTNSEERLGSVANDLNEVHDNISEMQILTADILSMLDRTGLRGVVSKSTMEMPSWVERPTMEDIKKAEKAQKMRELNEPGMHKPPPLQPGELELPAASWVKRWHDQKEGMDFGAPAITAKPPPVPILDGGEEAPGSNPPLLPAAEPKPPPPDTITELKEELYGIAATMKDRFEVMGLEPHKWESKYLKLHARVPKDELTKAAVTVQCINNRHVPSATELEEMQRQPEPAAAPEAQPEKEPVSPKRRASQASESQAAPPEPELPGQLPG